MIGSDADDAALARDLAVDAGRRLRDLQSAMGFSDPTALRIQGDESSHTFLLGRLGSQRPGDAVLSEEGHDDSRRTAARRVWIVDPLDGTREFAEEGRQDWAVHVALWADGELAVGAVSLPAVDAVFTSHPPPPVSIARGRRLRVVVSRTRPPAEAEAVAHALSAELVPMGSAGAKAMAVVTGDADVYVHAGGQYEWDSAAPVVVARAAGLHCSRVDGSALTYNRVDPLLPDLLVCRSDLAREVIEAAGRA